MAEFLRRKYAGQPPVTILKADVVEDDIAPQVGGPVDYVSAIGVMFHIVEDARWERAVANLAAVLKPGGLMFVGGDFGPRTRDVQFHAVDRFESWSEHGRAFAADGAHRVNKRVRSLAAWHELASRRGLEIVDLVRADREPGIMTPENDLLVLHRRSLPSRPAGGSPP
jgi:hypothetical protein